MSSIAKSGISYSKKDLIKSRIPPVASRNVTFYHKSPGGELSIDLLALSMPSEMPTNTQATVAEISGAQLAINKKNLTLKSTANGDLHQGLHYVVTSSTTIQLIGPYAVSGTEPDEIFTGIINSAPIGDLVVASAKSVIKTYELAIGQNTLNLGREYQTGQNINDDIGSIRVYINGVLAHRGVDYNEVDAGSGYGTTIFVIAAPVSLPYQVAVDFGVMSITDNNAIGTLESLSGSVLKIAQDLADIAGTNVNDYVTTSPSEIERRAFGDTVLSLNSKYDTTQNLSDYTETKFQTKFLASDLVIGSGNIATLTFNNLVIGKRYRISASSIVISAGDAALGFSTNGTNILYLRTRTASNQNVSGSKIFVAQSTVLQAFSNSAAGATFQGEATGSFTWAQLEELPNHEVTTQWT
jgi:hypothetical protein